MPVNSNTFAWICEHQVNIRKSIDALSVLVRPLLSANPLPGHLFVFCAATASASRSFTGTEPALPFGTNSSRARALYTPVKLPRQV